MMDTKMQKYVKCKITKFAKRKGHLLGGLFKLFDVINYCTIKRVLPMPSVNCISTMYIPEATFKFSTKWLL